MMNRVIRMTGYTQSLRIVPRRRRYCGISNLSENQENQERLLNEAERILGDKSFKNVYWLIPDNAINVAGHMQKRKLDNHPVGDVLRSIVSRSDITLGMVAMLLSKVTETRMNQCKYGNNYVNRVYKRQTLLPEILEVHYSIAKVTEMFSLTMKVHRSLSFKECAYQGYGNKIAVLIGDYLLGQSFNELAGLRDYDLLEFMGSALRDLTMGQYFGPRDKNNKPYPVRPQIAKGNISFLDTFSCDPVDIFGSIYDRRSEWFLRNTLGDGGLLGKACFSILKSAGYSQELQNVAYSFGKYFSLAQQALQDIKDLYSKTDAVNLTGLPVLLHLQKDEKLYEHIEKYKDNLEEINLTMIREKVLNGSAIEEAYSVKTQCTDAVFNILNIFDACDAHNLLQNMINYLKMEKHA